MDIKIRMTKGEWNKTKAYFDVIFVGISIPFNLTIKGCRLVEGSKGLFISPPSIKKEVDGETKYDNIVFFGDDTKDKVLKAALNEYNGVEEISEDELVEAAKNDIPF
tara:strand:+ start:825 stop:1145 length:321 start_codon:yes stop_codon:yes gene_type:complete